MKRVWSGQPAGDGVGPIGPPPARPGGPELLIGGYAPAAIRRAGRWADGFISGGVPDPGQVRQMFDLAEESWRAEGREGRPRLVASLYYALGPNAARGGDYIRDYYGYFGAAADDLARSIPSSPEAVEELIRGFGDVGADEVICWPTIAELDQVDRLGDLYTNNKRTYAHRRCRKMSCMQHCAYLSTAPRCSGLETRARMRDKQLGEPAESVLCSILDRNFREGPF